jgi:hypothetical protein
MPAATNETRRMAHPKLTPQAWVGARPKDRCPSVRARVVGAEKVRGLICADELGSAATHLAFGAVAKRILDDCARTDRRRRLGPGRRLDQRRRSGSRVRRLVVQIGMPSGQAREEATRFNLESADPSLPRCRGCGWTSESSTCSRVTNALRFTRARMPATWGRREWDEGRNDRLRDYGAMRAADDSVAFEAAYFGGGHSEQIREHGFGVLAESGRAPDGCPGDG